MVCASQQVTQPDTEQEIKIYKNKDKNTESSGRWDNLS